MSAPALRFAALSPPAAVSTAPLRCGAAIDDVAKPGAMRTCAPIESLLSCAGAIMETFARPDPNRGAIP